MPAIKKLMTFDSARCRWVKMHDGKRYTVSCKKQKWLPTESGSYQDANRWWQNKELELTASDSDKAASDDVRDKTIEIINRVLLRKSTLLVYH